MFGLEMNLKSHVVECALVGAREALAQVAAIRFPLPAKGP